MQHGRLAGTVRADQAQRLALPNPQAEIMQDFHLSVAGAQIVDRQKRTAISQRIQFRYLGSIGSDRGGFLGHLIDRHHHFDGTAAIAADAVSYTHLRAHETG